MKKSISTIILVLFSFGAIQAQSADEIVNKYIKAIGGAEKQKALKSRKLTMTLYQGGVQIPGAITADAANRQRMELTYNGLKMVQAYDGTTAWTINQFAGINAPTKLEGEQERDVKDTQFLDSFIDYKKRGVTIAYEGEEQFEGTACFKIKMTKPSGAVTNHYFDKESGLQIGESQTSGGQVIVSFYENYEATEGIMNPMKISQKSGGQTLLYFVVTKVEHNVEVSDDIFAFPAK